MLNVKLVALRWSFLKLFYLDLAPCQIGNMENPAKVCGGPQEVVIEKEDLSGKTEGTRKILMRRKLEIT